jgi:hypothetical protein
MCGMLIPVFLQWRIAENPSAAISLSTSTLSFIKLVKDSFDASEAALKRAPPSFPAGLSSNAAAISALLPAPLPVLASCSSPPK